MFLSSQVHEKLKQSSFHKFKCFFFPPADSNRLVLSCSKGDILLINFCEIINTLKEKEVGLFHKVDPRRKKPDFSRETEFLSDVQIGLQKRTMEDLIIFKMLEKKKTV